MYSGSCEISLSTHTLMSFDFCEYFNFLCTSISYSVPGYQDTRIYSAVLLYGARVPGTRVPGTGMHERYKNKSVAVGRRPQLRYPVIILMRYQVPGTRVPVFVPVVPGY